VYTKTHICLVLNALHAKQVLHNLSDRLALKRERASEMKLIYILKVPLKNV